MEAQSIGMFERMKQIQDICQTAQSEWTSLTVELAKQVQDVCQVVQTEWTALNELVDREQYLDVDGVAQYMGIPKSAASTYMNRPDFPVLKACGQSRLVSKTALFLYNLERKE